ncbi:20175_t:CDS:1, partial [Racocetra fulgida]
MLENYQPTKLNLEGLLIDLVETKTGKQFLSCQLDGQHYRGFIIEKRTITEQGGYNSERINKFTYLKPCNWE